MIVPVHIVGYSNMVNSINGNTQSNTVYFQTPEDKPIIINSMNQRKAPKHRMFTLADVPLLTVAALSTKPKTLSAFAKSFTRLPVAILGLAIPASIAAGATTKIVDKRNKKGKSTEPILAMAAFGGAWYGLYKAGEAGIKKLAQVIPDSFKSDAAKGIKNVSEKIDASALNKKVYEPVANKVKEVLKAHPQIWKPAMIVSSIAALAICLSPSIRRNRKANKEAAQREQIARMIQEQRALEIAQMKEFDNMFNKVM